MNKIEYDPFLVHCKPNKKNINLNIPIYIQELVEEDTYLYFANFLYYFGTQNNVKQIYEDPFSFWPIDM